MVALIFFLGLLMIPLSMFNNVKTKYINKSTGEEVKMVIDRKSNIHVCEHVFIPFIFEGKTLTQEELESELTIVPITTFKLFNFRTLFAWGAWLFAILYFACTYYFLFTKYLGGDNRHIIDIVYPPQKKQKKK